MNDFEWPESVTMARREQWLVEQAVAKLNHEPGWPIGLRDLFQNLRDVLAAFVTNPGEVRAAQRSRVVERLRDAFFGPLVRMKHVLSHPLKPADLLSGSRPELPPFPRTPERGRLVCEARFAFPKRGGLQINVLPVIENEDQQVLYGVALLLDTRRDLGRTLAICPAPLVPRVRRGSPKTSEEALRQYYERRVAGRRCGRFFFRTTPRQTYCDRWCRENGTREKNRLRQSRRRAPSK